jgi:drug/metabolite transporter (DMT)-like permease
LQNEHVLVVALIAIAAIAHATWNLAIKRAGTTGAGFLWLTFVVAVVVFAPFGIWSLAIASPDIGRWLFFAVISGALQVGYFLLLQRGYRKGDVSVVYPLARGTGPLLSVIFAVILFAERPGWLGLVGAGVVIAGVVIVGLAGGKGAAAVNRAGVLYGLAVGVLIAAYTLWDSNAVTTGGMPVVGLYWGSVVAQALILAPAAIRERGALRAIAGEHWRAVLVVGILSPLAYILVLLAIQSGAPVSIVAPAREVSVVLVSLAGWLLLREPHPVQRLVGSAVVLAGVAVLAASTSSA